MLLASFTSFSQVSLQLTPSNYNGFNISCFGASNGSINLTITGGTPPYSILWSTNETTEDLINLPAGYYRVTVNDADTSSGPVETEITLIEPRKLTLTVSAYKYPNNFNISLYEACNGAISLNATDGVSPYTWLWNDGNTSQNRTSLCAETFAMTVTDANGCTDKNLNTKLFQPDRSDWQQAGNTGTNPSNNFIGTVDSVDLVFKTNNTEHLRISSDGTTTIMGTLKIDTASTDSSRMVYVDTYGNLKTIGPGNPIPVQKFFWHINGNDIDDQDDYIGTNNQSDMIFKTTSSSFTGPIERMRIKKSGGILINGSAEISGAVSIGTTTPQPGYQLLVDNGKAGFREVFVKLTGPWPDYVFDSEYKLQPPSEIEKFFRVNKHLQNMPSAKDIETDGQNIGEIQRVQQEHIEVSYLYIIELYKTVAVLKSEIDDLKNEIAKLKSRQ